MLLDELVFKSRNKLYGAYDLKKRYPKYVLISLLLSTCIFAVVILISFLININKQLTIKKFSAKNVTIAMELMKIEQDEELKEFLKQEEKKTITEENLIIEEQKANKIISLNVIDSLNTNKPNLEEIADSIFTKMNKKDPRLDTPGIFECGSNLLNFRMWFMENFKCPVDDRIKKTEGRIMIVFIVNENGIIDSVDIVSGIDPIIDSEAKRVLLTSPRWKPCIINGQKVKQLYHFPIFLVRKI